MTAPMRTVSLLLLTLTASASFGQDAKDARGFMQALDTTNGTITLSLLTAKAKVFRVKTFNLLKADIPVTNMAGQPLKLSDVEEESLITLKLNAEDDVLAIVAPLPTLHGYLTRLDPASRQLVVKTAIGERPVTAPEDAKVLISNNPAQLKDLKVGSTISVMLTQDQKSVLEIRMGKGVVLMPKPLKASGTVIDVDRGKAQMRIYAPKLNGDFYTLSEVAIAKDATFTLMFLGRPHRELTLQDMSGGVTGTYWTESATSKLVHMDIEMPVLNMRVLKSIDLEKREVTLADGDAVKTYALSPSLKVTGGAGKLADLRTGLNVNCGLHPDRKQVEWIVLRR